MRSCLPFRRCDYQRALYRVRTNLVTVDWGLRLSLVVTARVGSREARGESRSRARGWVGWWRSLGHCADRGGDADSRCFDRLASMERSGVLWTVSKGPSNFTDFESAWTRTDLQNATTMVHDGHFVRLWRASRRREARRLRANRGRLRSAGRAPSSRRGHPA